MYMVKGMFWMVFLFFKFQNVSGDEQDNAFLNDVLSTFKLTAPTKEDARAVALRDLLLFFAFNLTWPGRVEVGWHETSQSN